MSVAVKICGLTTLEDTIAAVEAGADAVGFVFDRGPCRIEWAQGAAIVAALSESAVEKVAVVGPVMPAPRLLRGFDVVQWVPPEAGASSVCSEVRSSQEGSARAMPEAETSVPESLTVLPAFFDSSDLVARVHAWARLHPIGCPQPNSLKGTVNLDGAGGGGTGQQADWSRARGVASAFAVTLSGGLRPDNLKSAVRSVRPHAVDVSSGVEAAPGRKDPALMKAFVQAAKEAV